jgi:hypothetical protein
MKRFMFLSIGVLCLSLAALVGFHIGSRSAIAQTDDFVAGYRVMPYGVGGTGLHFVMLSNGDVYSRHDSASEPWTGSAPRYLGNFWESTVPVAPSTIGGVKAKYR